MDQNKVLIIGTVWPEPNSSAAGIRMIQIIEFFEQNNYRIFFASASAKSGNEQNLSIYGVEEINIELNNTSFDSFLLQLNPDIVVFDRFITEEQYGWRVEETCPKALRILDTEDLHFLRKTREQAFKKNIELKSILFKSEITKREIASIYRCDFSLIISKMEMELLKTDFNIDESLIFYFPILQEKIELKSLSNFPSFEKRTNFISIGNFLHEPNFNSVVLLKEKIWPLIRKKLPDAELHIYGAYPTAKVLEMNNPKMGFIIKGKATDANEIMQNYKICLAPIQFGAGIKGKLLLAMKNGTPSVTTSIGAEAMYINNWAGKICDNPEEFADAAVELYQNQTSWKDSQMQGFEIIDKLFDPIFFFNEFKLKIESHKKNLELLREKNFIGSMLNYHTLKSTKYMAKWIEEKGRDKN